MSKKTNEFFQQIKAGEQPSLLESIREIAGKIWDEGKPMFDHGRTELASGLYSGHGHVMYMKGMYNDGNEGAQRAQEQAKEPPERERDMGREM